MIPEIYYFPPLFENINDLELKKISSNHEIDNVIIHDFNEKKERKYTFLKDMRNYLENEPKLNLWIDLIFGVNKDYNAERQRYYNKNSNVSFKPNEKIMNDELIMQSYDFGVLPYQFLTEQFPEKPKVSQNLKFEIDKFNYKQFHEDHINCLTGKITFFCKGEKGINKEYFKLINKIKDENRSFFGTIFNTINIFSKDKNKEENFLYLFAGDIFGNLHIYNKTDKTLKIDNSPIKEISEYKILLDKINNEEYNLFKTLNDHVSEIKCIDYNPRLNLIVDYALDGYINLYTMPSLKLVRSIQTRDFDINEIINQIALASNPFPIIYCITSKNIVIFDINGKLINKINNYENSNLMICIDKNCGLFNDNIYKLINGEAYKIEF